MSGTPKTLDQAISNALNTIVSGTMHPRQRYTERSWQVQILRKDVKDFLAQRFGVIDDEALVIWKRIFPEDGPSGPPEAA